MNHTIIHGKPYMVGELRWHIEAVPYSGGPGVWTERAVSEIFDGEKFVSMNTSEAFDTYNKVLRDIYRRLDALESKVNR